VCVVVALVCLAAGAPEPLFFGSDNNDNMNDGSNGGGGGFFSKIGDIISFKVNAISSLFGGGM